MPKLQLGNYTRVVVTGDPSWPSDGYYAIKERLQRLPKKKKILVIVTDARGASVQAELAASLLGYKTKIIKSEQKKYREKASRIRDLRIFEEFRPQFVIAFYNKGAKNDPIVKLSRARRIPVEVVAMLRVGV